MTNDSFELASKTFHSSAFLTILPFRKVVVSMEVNPNSPSDESTIQQPFGSPNSRGRKGLGKPVIRKLLRDIEERGGIHTFSIKNLCDCFPETYGFPNTIQRRRVQNKVNKWKLLTLERFQAVQLKYLAIVGEERNHILHSFAHPPASTTLERANSSDSSSHQYSRRSLSSPAVPNQEAPVFESPPPLSAIMLSSAMTISRPASTSETAAHIQRALDSNDFGECVFLFLQQRRKCLPVSHLRADSVEIEVNIDHPEKNREVQVFNFTGVKTKGKFHNGYAIEMNVDVRDVKKGLYRAYFLPDNHHVFIKAPPGLCSSSNREDHAILADKEKLRSRFCEKLHDARHVSRNEIKDSEKRTSKNIVLSFPCYMTLSNLIYSPDTTADGLIKMKKEPYKNKVVVGIKEYATLHCCIVLKLHLVEAAERVFEKQKEGLTDEDELVDALDEGMEGMKIG